MFANLPVLLLYFLAPTIRLQKRYNAFWFKKLDRQLVNAIENQVRWSLIR
jgi:hypothetical protein